MNGVVGRSAIGNGLWGESLGTNTGVVGKSATGNGVHAESLGGGHGIYATSKTGDAISASSEGGNGITSTSKGSGIGVNANSASGIGLSASGGKLAGYFKGDVEVTGDIRLVNADCAEEFDINNSQQQVEPGTVMVLDSNGSLEPSCTPYDKKVAGIISGAGGYKPGIVLDKQQQDLERQENNSNQLNNTSRMAIALMGKVYCKVDATLSSIEIGDLLTTSQTTGHAMKADDPFKAFGAVIGKALQPLKGGKGMISVLVALQ
jgi:hypothetical protein